MKTFFLSFLLFSSALDARATVLLSFQFAQTDIAESTPYTTTHHLDSRLTLSSGLRLGAGLTSVVSTNSWAVSRDFQTPTPITSISAAITHNVYYGFTLTIAPGYELNLNRSLIYQSFQATSGAPGYAPDSAFLMYSPAGFTSADPALGYSDISNQSLVYFNDNLITGLDHLTGSVEFRFYLWATGSSDPTEDPSGTLRVAQDRTIGPFVPLGGGVYTPSPGENLILDATINAVPEPTAASLLLIGAGALLLRSRRRAR